MYIPCIHPKNNIMKSNVGLNKKKTQFRVIVQVTHVVVVAVAAVPNVHKMINYNECAMTFRVTGF